MKRRRFRGLAVGAAAVTDWSMYAQTAIIGTGPPPTAHASVLTFAMVQGAVYDAVNGIDGGHRPYLVKPVATPFDSKAAAAATAAFPSVDASRQVRARSRQQASNGSRRRVG